MDRQYRTDVSFYTTNQRIIANCNAITFINNGTIDLYINNFPLPAGTTFGIAGNSDEIDITEYIIDFRGATNGSVYVIKKINQ